VLSVIVPTRDKATRLRVCLRALADAGRGLTLPWELIVVDDGSGPETAEVLRVAADHLSIRVVRRDDPGGRSVARNAGAAAARGRRLLFLDDDILVDRHALARHAEAGDGAVARATILNLPWLRAMSDPTNGAGLPPRVAARAVREVPGRPVIEDVGGLARRSRFEADLHALLRSRQLTGRWPAATGGNLSIAREAFERLDGFDSAMGLDWGLEDLDLGFRAEQAGLYIEHLKDAAVLHMDHVTMTRTDQHDAALDRFARKHGAAVARDLGLYFAGQASLLEAVSA
jgi:glycosyltransferase involved in cell wall biosynthesis